MTTAEHERDSSPSETTGEQYDYLMVKRAARKIPALNKPMTEFSSSQISYNYILRIVLLGDTRVGKTSLLNRFHYDKFSKVVKPTIGGEFISKKGLKVDGARTLVHLIDTSGNPRFRSIISSYLRGFMTYFLVYDVTNRKSLDIICQWNSAILSRSSNDDTPTVRFLVANKIDCPVSHRQVSTEEGERLAEEMDALYYETSAKSGEGVEEMMMDGLEKSLKVYRRSWETEQEDGGGGWCNIS